MHGKLLSIFTIISAVSSLLKVILKIYMEDKKKSDNKKEIEL